jgi:hypothetical protein
MTDDLETRDFNAIARGRTVLTTWFRFVLSTATGEQSEPSKPESPAVRMLGTSRELVLLGYHGPAMVTAQTLSDTYFGEVMASLFHHHQMEHVHSAVASALRGYSLGRAEHIAIYQSLTEDPLRQARFWEGYTAGRKRRDAWAHGMHEVQRQDSAAFILSVADFIEHVEGLLESRAVEKPPTEVGSFKPVEEGWALDVRRRPSEAVTRPLSPPRKRRKK